jgi:hypothetical protein
MLEKCYILKTWHFIAVTKNNFLPKGFLFTFVETFVFIKLDDNFWIKIFLQCREQESYENILNSQLKHITFSIIDIFKHFDA